MSLSKLKQDRFSKLSPECTPSPLVKAACIFLDEAVFQCKYPLHLSGWNWLNWIMDYLLPLMMRHGDRRKQASPVGLKYATTAKILSGKMQYSGVLMPVLHHQCS
jgi:hypothetical protein